MDDRAIIQAWLDHRADADPIATDERALRDAMAADEDLRRSLLADAATDARLRVLLCDDGDRFAAGLLRRLRQVQRTAPMEKGRGQPWWRGRRRALVASSAAMVLVAVGALVMGWRPGSNPADSAGSGGMEPPVRVAFVAGDLRRSDGTRAVVGMALGQGDSLETAPQPDAPDTPAVLRLGGTGEIRLASGTRIALQAPRRMLLERGRLHARIGHDGGTGWEVIGSAATAAILGTRFTMSVDDRGTTLQVEEGRVRFHNQLGEQQVGILQSSRADTGRRPGPARPIAAAELWRGDPGTVQADAALVAAWPCDGLADGRLPEAAGRWAASADGIRIVDGIRNGALRLDGRQTIRVPGTGRLDLRHLSLALWIRPARDVAAMDSDYPALLTQNIPPSQTWTPGFTWRPKGFVLGSLSSRGGGLGLRIGNGSAHYHQVEMAAPAPGTWTHVAAVFDGGELTLYRDGLPIARAPAATSLDPEETDVLIGQGWIGDLDEVRIYRVALTPEEVRALALP
ncbi:MAG: hypothetical protein RLZZ127_2815 [Planctomycetota bacterium]|jgi:ferric-dicitrate binding protein FerR (iron transport regulator)